MPQHLSQVALAARRDETTLELSQQFDVHPNQIVDWKNQLLNNAGIAFDAQAPAVDVKVLQPGLASCPGNDFFRKCAHQSGPAVRKTMIDRAPLSRSVICWVVPVAVSTTRLYRYQTLAWR